MWTEQALKNLLEIKDYISRDSVFYAERVTRQIFDAVQILEEHPEAGKIIQKQKQGVLRRLIIKSYRIIYLYRSDVVKVVAVYHQSRQNTDPFDLGEITE